MKKPELIAFSYNLLGGSASFYKNLFKNNPTDIFNVKGIILEYDWKDHIPPIEDVRVHKNDVIVKVKFDNYLRKSYKIAKGVSNENGLIVCSDTNELMAFDLFRKSNKAIYFICHDDAYLSSCKKYQHLIDVYIAHNFSIYQDIIKLLPERKSDVFFIPHGIEIKENLRGSNDEKNLKIVFLARHHKSKGIYDLIDIDTILRHNNLEVEWCILGDGPERENFKNSVKDSANFNFLLPLNQDSLYDILKDQDVFILPSRLDGLPVSLLETMSQGCVPIVSKFNEGIRKIVSDEIGFVINVGDNKGFAEKIILLDKNRELLKKMSLESKNKVAKDHDIKNQAQKYFDLFKEFEKFKREKGVSFMDLRRISNNINAVKAFKKFINKFRY